MPRKADGRAGRLNRGLTLDMPNRIVEEQRHVDIDILDRTRTDSGGGGITLFRLR